MNTYRLAALQNHAAVLDEAALQHREMPMLTPDDPQLSVVEAYEVQDLVIERRIARGERQVGMKMGLTSRAKMEQVGVDEPIYGVLTSGMIVNDGGTVELGGLCHPRCEPEIAFVMARDLTGPVTPSEALAAVRGVCAALEVIDSRYRDFKFTLPDVIADNTSAARFVLGSSLVAPDAFDLGNLGILLEVDGAIVDTASSAAVLDHPARSLAELANMLAHRGRGLRAGDIVLSGGATAAIALAPGMHVRAIVEKLGSAELRAA